MCIFMSAKNFLCQQLHADSIRVVITFLCYNVHICQIIIYAHRTCVRSMIRSECNTNLPCPYMT